MSQIFYLDKEVEMQLLVLINFQPIWSLQIIFDEQSHFCRSDRTHVFTFILKPHRYFFFIPKQTDRDFFISWLKFFVVSV